MIIYLFSHYSLFPEPLQCDFTTDPVKLLILSTSEVWIRLPLAHMCFRKDCVSVRAEPNPRPAQPSQTAADLPLNYREMSQQNKLNFIQNKRTNFFDLFLHKENKQTKTGCGLLVKISGSLSLWQQIADISAWPFNSYGQTDKIDPEDLPIVFQEILFPNITMLHLFSQQYILKTPKWEMFVILTRVTQIH